mmetsp:Transcript_60763/g.144723  ORF Transcript_60763/g.144723 Transcript_60763/m.144723 type:complete len:236 (-) Transcript_60763:341-1048(-)
MGKDFKCAILLLERIRCVKHQCRPDCWKRGLSLEQPEPELARCRWTLPWRAPSATTQLAEQPCSSLLREAQPPGLPRQVAQAMLQELAPGVQVQEPRQPPALGPHHARFLPHQASGSSHPALSAKSQPWLQEAECGVWTLPSLSPWPYIDAQVAAPMRHTSPQWLTVLVEAPSPLQRLPISAATLATAARCCWSWSCQQPPSLGTSSAVCTIAPSHRCRCLVLSRCACVRCHQLW